MTLFRFDQIEALSAPLVREHVKKNPRGFSYVEGWHAIAEANRIFGFGEWDRLTEELRQLGDPREVDGKVRVSYFARVRIIVRGPDGVVTRDGCGYGSGIDKDLGQAHESAIKEAETDAMKRALMTFGWPFGLALYDKEQVNVVAHAGPTAAFEAAAAAIDKLESEEACVKWWKDNAKALAAADRDPVILRIKDRKAAIIARRTPNDPIDFPGDRAPTGAAAYA